MHIILLFFFVQLIVTKITTLKTKVQYKSLIVILSGVEDGVGADVSKHCPHSLSPTCISKVFGFFSFLPQNENETVYV